MEADSQLLFLEFSLHLWLGLQESLGRPFGLEEMQRLEDGIQLLVLRTVQHHFSLKVSQRVHRI